MEFVVYAIYFDDNCRRMGSFITMMASREEAEEYARELGGEHEVVGLWTRELAEDDGYETVVFEEDGSVRPTGEGG